MKVVDFLKFKKITVFSSILLMILSFASIIFHGFNYGIDFKGGVTTEMEFTHNVSPDEIKNIVDASFSEVTVFNYGSPKNIVIQTPVEGDYKNAGAVISKMVYDGGITDGKLIRNEIIGPKVGDELKTNGILALIVVIISVLVYISLRFEFKFAIGAVIALIHDLFITAGMISVVGIDMDLTVLAALLAILGYSLNDTIVVYDRIRENLQKFSDKNVYDIINISLSETLSRTIMTSLTTAATLIAIYLFSGESLKPFSVVLLFGVGIGTYSSVYVASSFLNLLNINKEQFKKEKVDTENGVI